MSNHTLQAVVETCYQEGVRLTHRPPGIKVAEGETTVLTEVLHDQQSGLSVGDAVHVDVTRLVPWHEPLVMYQLTNYGLDPEYYLRRNNSRGKWLPREFTLLCFARVYTVRKHKCRISGMFGILGLPNTFPICVVHSDKSPVRLHWIEALRRAPQTDE